MSDDRDGLEPSDRQTYPFDLSLSDEELGRTMRQAMLEEERAAPTTDEHGHPLPHLDLSEPRPETDDPLLKAGYALLAELPQGWEFAALTVTAAADEIRTSVIVRVGDVDGLSHRHLLYLPNVIEACLALRHSMYEADGRAWYNAYIRLDQSGVMRSNYDFDGPPFTHWGPREVDLVLRDQELYPRDPGQLPAWHPAR